MDAQKVKRTLKCEFSDAEMLELGRDLSIKSQELRNLEEQKKSVVSEFGSRMTIAKEQISSLSDKVASGYEMRDISCEVDFHVPERGKKTFTRTDTGEQWIEPMNDADYGLFTQWEDQERERAESEQAEVEAMPQVEGDPEGDPEQDDEYNGGESWDAEAAGDAEQPRGTDGKFQRKAS